MKDEAKPVNPWLILVGPTAVGKSAVAEILAEQFQTDIIIADSRQIYQKLDIGTGKPSLEARKRVHRHLIDMIAPDQFYSAGAYKSAARTVIAGLEQEGKNILIEGGSGLYIKALLYGLWEGPPADWAFRETLRVREKTEGEGTLHRDLLQLDPALCAKVHTKDLQKIIRALEVQHLTGRLLSEIHSEEAEMRVNAETAHSIIGLRRDRDDLYQRINTRVDQYIKAGLVEEVAALLASGLTDDLPAMRGLGYRQMIPHLRGEQGLEEAIERLKRDTRRFSKRQMTWFRSDRNIQWIDLGVDESAEETVTRIMRLKKEFSVL